MPEKRVETYEQRTDLPCIEVGKRVQEWYTSYGRLVGITRHFVITENHPERLIDAVRAYCFGWQNFTRQLPVAVDGWMCITEEQFEKNKCNVNLDIKALLQDVPTGVVESLFHDISRLFLVCAYHRENAHDGPNHTVGDYKHPYIIIFGGEVSHG